MEYIRLFCKLRNKSGNKINHGNVSHRLRLIVGVTSFSAFWFRMFMACTVPIVVAPRSRPWAGTRSGSPFPFAAVFRFLVLRMLGRGRLRSTMEVDRQSIHENALVFNHNRNYDCWHALTVYVNGTANAMVVSAISLPPRRHRHHHQHLYRCRLWRFSNSESFSGASPDRETQWWMSRNRCCHCPLPPS